MFCCFVYIQIYQIFTYIYSYFYFLKILARIWSVFRHGLYFFHFCIYADLDLYADYIPRINKAFIHSLIHEL